MKKLIILITLLILCSCTKVSDDPKKILFEAIEKHSKLTSLSMDGDIDLDISSDNSISLPVNIDLNMIHIFNSHDDLKDDETYMHILVPVLISKYEARIWNKDSVLYLDDGTNRRRYPYQIDDNHNFNVNDFIKIIIECTDDFSLESKGDKLVITITPDEKMIKEIIKYVSDNNSEILNDINIDALIENTSFSDLYMTIDSKGYITDISTEISSAYEGYKIDGEIDLKLKDFDSSVIPSFDPEQFN